MIKQGMYVGLGEGVVQLLVHVDSTDGSVFNGLVINGNWELRYDTITEQMIVYNPFGAEMHDGIKILFRDPLPMKVGYDNYDEVIYYMNNHLNRLALVSLYLRAKYKFEKSVSTLYKRLKTSTQMFIRTWKNGSTDIRYVHWDDDIPF